MKDAATLLALAERVETLTGADREADALAYCVTGGLEKEWPGSSELSPVVACGRFYGRTPCIPEERLTFAQVGYRGPRFTAYLDAAMTLVPEGHWAEGSLGTHNDTRAALEIHGPCTFDPIGRAWAATPALALTAACLRAHAAIAGKG